MDDRHRCGGSVGGRERALFVGRSPAGGRICRSDAAALAVQGLTPARVSKGWLCRGFRGSCRCAALDASRWNGGGGGVAGNHGESRSGRLADIRRGQPAPRGGQGLLPPAPNIQPHNLRWKVSVSRGREGMSSGCGCSASPLAWWQRLISSAESSPKLHPAPFPPSPLPARLSWGWAY